MPTEPKRCPLCSLGAPEVEFGVCRARIGGQNLYCKDCLRKKVAASRQALKEYRAVRKSGSAACKSRQFNLLDEVRTERDNVRVALSPVERVREALRQGARTQAELRAAAHLGGDEVGDALAEMILWTREVESQIVDNVRHYFLRDQQSANSKQPIRVGSELRTSNSELPGRKPDVRAGFASIPELMPARITDTRKVG